MYTAKPPSANGRVGLSLRDSVGRVSIPSFRADHPEAGSRLQSRLKPTEADWNAENPTAVGLISMLTGSGDMEEIKTVIRRLYERGTNILGIKLSINYESLTE